MARWITAGLTPKIASHILGLPARRKSLPTDNHCRQKIFVDSIVVTADSANVGFRKNHSIICDQGPTRTRTCGLKNCLAAIQGYDRFPPTISLQSGDIDIMVTVLRLIQIESPILGSRFTSGKAAGLIQSPCWSWLVRASAAGVQLLPPLRFRVTIRPVNCQFESSEMCPLEMTKTLVGRSFLGECG